MVNNVLNSDFDTFNLDFVRYYLVSVLDSKPTEINIKIFIGLMPDYILSHIEENGFDGRSLIMISSFLRNDIENIKKKFN